MKTCLLILSGLLLLFTSVSAQDAVYEKVYFAPSSFENDQIKIEVTDVVSLPKETKFKMTITNKTNNYIVYNSEESNFEIPGQDVRAKEKSWIIEPLQTKNKVMRAFGEGLNDIREFSFACQGLYLINVQEPFTAAPFRLPPSSNTFETGPMQVILKKESRATGKSNVKWDVKYTGTNYGFIYPHKISVLMPDGINYATTETKMDPVILTTGEDQTISASWDRMPGGKINDMQKVPMLIHFDGVFAEGSTEKIPGQTLRLNWDEALTIANK